MSSTKIDRTDSQMMGFSRVVCIFFMMSVHFYPYGDKLSILHGGLLWPVGVIWIDFLGRASVATLSFVSGYLLWVALKDRTVLTIFRQKILALILPMVTWNIIFIAAAAAFMLMGANPDVLPDFQDPVSVLNAITGALGPTANLSLFFIRDLFISSMLIVMGWPVLKRAPILCLFIVIGITLSKSTEPVIFRPMILLFMLSGCFLHEKGCHLHQFAAPRVALPIILACFAFSIFINLQSDLFSEVLMAQMRGVVLRLSLIVTILMIARECVNRKFHSTVSKFERGAYLTYLSHILLAKLFWEIFSAFGASPNGFSYVVYFLVTPFLIFFAATSMVNPLRRLPGALPIILTGRNGFTKKIVTKI